MSWHWTAIGPRAVEEGVGYELDTQADAETWLTAAYLDLTDAGVTAVSLYEEDRLVYGPMSLSE